MIRIWWQARAPRERVILLAGAAFVSVALIWALLLNPMAQHRAELARTVPEQRAFLAWMNSLNASAGRPAGAAQGSLFSVVDRSARATALAGTLSRIQPEGVGTVRVWFDDAPFNDLVMWLAALEREQGVQVTAFAADRTASPGRVSARLTLSRP